MNSLPLKLKTLLLMVILSGFVFHPGISSAIDIPSNQWTPFTPTVQYLPGYNGYYQFRKFSELLYISTLGKVLTYSGYVDNTYATTIYSNTLYLLDPSQNVLTMEKINYWQNIGGGTYITEPLPENQIDPTPSDRHPYAQMAFVPETNSVYMWGGANKFAFPEWEMWAYSFSTKKWSQLPPLVAPTVDILDYPRNGLEQAMVYDPPNRKLVLFGGAQGKYGKTTYTCLFDIDTKKWEMLNLPGPSPRWGQNLVYDPIRQRSLLFGGGTSWPNGGNDLWSFDAAARKWTELTPVVSPPKRRMAGFAYDSKRDVFVLWGGTDNGVLATNETWVYYPQENVWRAIAIQSPPPSDMGASQNLAYDVQEDVFIVHTLNRWYMLKVDPQSGYLDKTPPKAPQQL